MPGLAPPLGIADAVERIRKELASPRPGDHVPFSFTWAGCAFQGRLEAGPKPVIRLAARLGKLPFSAEDAPQRRRIRQWLRGEARAGRSITCDITPQGHVLLTTATAIRADLTAVSLLQSLTLILLALRPHLQCYRSLCRSLCQSL